MFNIEYISLRTVTDKSGTIKREYDALNRVTSYTDAAGNKIGYSYDKVGNLTGLTYPNGKTVKYEYSADNKLTKVTDWAGRVTSYDYDVRGRLTTTTRPDGSKETSAYDNGDQLLTQTDTDKSGNIINKYSYSYDLNGNVTSEKNDFTDNIFVNRADGSKDMTYGADNRLMAYNGNSIQYDADGNMTSGPLKGSMLSFAYDSQNQLTSAGSTTYGYDGEGNRISVTENQKTTKYVINPEASMSETLVRTDGDGKTTCYIYGLGLIGEEESDGSYLTYHFDRRGSTTALTDINGNVTDRYTYGPYGEMAEHKGTSTTPFMFNGKDGVMTDSNGLYYMRSRYYNPEIKRFINMDTVTGNINDSKTMNRFAYANGNPINMVDPFGTSATDPKSQADYIMSLAAQSIQAENAMYDAMNDMFGLSCVCAVLAPVMTPWIALFMEEMNMMTSLMDTMIASEFLMASSLYKQAGDTKASIYALGMGGVYAVNAEISLLIDAAAKSRQAMLPKSSQEGQLALPAGPDGPIALPPGPQVTKMLPAGTGNGKGFDSFNSLKKYLGSPGKNNEWHHIVEQCQIQKSGFSSFIINNTDNIISVDEDIHRKISGFYSSKTAFSQGVTVRNWMSGQSFEKQYKFGMKVLKDFGVIK